MHAIVQQAELPDLLGLVTGFFVALTLLGTALGYLLEWVFRARRIWAVPLDEGQLRTELIGNVVFLMVTITTFTWALSTRWMRFGEDSGAAIALTFVVIYLAFQLYYYGFHRALHDRRWVRFHRWHHKSRVTTPLSGQSMSLVEALGWMVGYVAIPACLSQVMPISFDGWALYIAYNVLGNIAGHANVEPIPPLPGLRYASVISNVYTYHALHHARWNGNYGFATALMDRVCRTEWPDWPELHARTAHGNPMPDLHTKGNGYKGVGPQ